MNSAGVAELPYLDAFVSPSRDTWRAAVDKVLKGADFEKRLVGRTSDGIRIEPLYSAASKEVRPARGEAGRWHVAARVDHPYPDHALALALADLEGGSDTLTVCFSGATASRGYGVVADNVATLDAALHGVMFDLIRLRLEPAPQGRVNALLLAALIEKRGLDPNELSVEFGLNPIGVLASQGTLAATWPEIQRRHTSTVRTLKERGFEGPFVAADSRPFHEAGASEAYELAAMLSTAVAYLRMLETNGLTLTEARDAIAFTLVADTDEFTTVAKFRAARTLWDRVQQACGLDPQPMRLHAETAWRSLTKHDPWVNILRGTVGAFAAGVSGADSITVQPFTAALGLPDAFARRVARNTQLILLEESNLWRVADPAAGAGGFESLTEELCARAWNYFQEIEGQRSGDLRGVVAALINGHLQRILADQRLVRARAVATRRLPLTGTSEYPNLDEGPVTVLDVAPVEKKADLPPGSLADQDQHEILRSFVSGGDRHDAMVIDLKSIRTGALPSVRLSEPFEALRDRAAGCWEQPVVFLATIGRVADFTARAGFARNLFEAGGIRAVSGDGFAQGDGTDLEAMVAAFKASNARLACLCGTGAGYAAEGKLAAEQLIAAGATVWLVGRAEENEALAGLGISSFISIGCDVVEVLKKAQAIAASGDCT